MGYYAIEITSFLSFAAWLGAVWLVALKLGSANGSYRLLTLILAICVISTVQAVAFCFNAIEFPRHGTTDVFTIGSVAIRVASILGALAVIYYGRPGAPVSEIHTLEGEVIVPRQTMAVETGNVTNNNGEENQNG